MRNRTHATWKHALRTALKDRSPLRMLDISSLVSSFRRRCNLKFRQFPVRRRCGYAIVSTLSEILLIGVLLGGVVFMMRELLQTSPGSSNEQPATTIDPIFRLGNTSSCGLWAQLGFSELVSIDLTTLRTRSVYRSTDIPMTGLNVSQDGETFLVLLGDREIVVFRNEELLFRELVPLETEIKTALSADGNTVALLLGRNTVRCWNLSESTPNSWEHHLYEISDRILLSPNGDKFIVLTVNGHLDVYESKMGTRWQVTDVGRVEALPAISDDGRWLALTSDENLTLCDLQRHEIEWSVYTGPYDDLRTVAISASNRLIAVSSCRSGIHIHDGTTGRILNRFPLEYSVKNMVFSASADLLYACGSSFNSIRVFSLSSGQELKPIDLSSPNMI